MRKIVLILLIINLIFSIQLVADTKTQLSQNADQWVVTDAAGRTLPSYQDVGPVRPGKLVGVFYYTWLGTHGDKVYDISKIITQPEANRPWGPVNAFHFGTEPEYGYYRSEDPWVIRRDLQMLSNAKVDFLYIDATNAFTYLNVIRALCEVSRQMRTEGIQTPQITFATNSSSGVVMNQLYDQFYKQNEYSELWFRWNGKPLVLGEINDPALRPDVKNFFTIRKCWVGSTNLADMNNHWPWLNFTPQTWGWSGNSNNREQVSVSMAFHPESTRGKSWTTTTGEPSVNANYITASTGMGLHGQEQWNRALAVDPQVIMVTQWNEWVAQRFIWNKGNGIYGGRSIKNGDSYFVDVFSPEFSRDMAPMKGGYTDNYYYQLVSNIRKYKGMEPPIEPSSPKTIAINGDFSQWSDVSPEYWDPRNETIHRNHPSYDPNIILTNTTGRNDLISSKVTHDNQFVYFYAKTASNLTAHTDSNWMLLLIDTDKSKNTGWEGYDLLINQQILNQEVTIVKKWENANWVTVGETQYRKNGTELELKVPRHLFGQNIGNLQFNFKWADNIQNLNTIENFFLYGDVAPDRRFNYSYDYKTSATMTCDNSYEFYLNGSLIGSGNNWMQAQKFTNINLQNGKNVIAIKAVDAGGVAGFLAELKLNSQTVVTNSNWKVSQNAPANWTSAAYDDASWAAATEYGAYGVSPWFKNVTNMPAYTQAKWIWSNDNNNHNQIYLRCTINNGTVTPVTVQSISTNITQQDQTGNYLCNNDEYEVYANGVAGANNVLFPTWTILNGQDELDWIQGVYESAQNRWKAVVKRSSHNNELGLYVTHIYGINGAGEAKMIGDVKVVLNNNISFSSTMTCDNSYEFYLNGTLIGSGNNWMQTQNFANLNLQNGRNVIAVKAVDAGGVAGFLSELKLNGQRIGTNSNWKVSLSAPTGWNSLSFNDASWAAATEYGAYGVSPWFNNVAGMPLDTPAKWIWSNDANNHDVVYFRYIIQNSPGSNVALNKPTIQSSTPYAIGASSKAVDGNNNGNWDWNNNSVTHTHCEQGAWWQVDLGSKYKVNYIKIWGRTDGGIEYLSDFKVYYLDANGNVITSYNHPESVRVSTDLNTAVNDVRFVKIQLNGTNCLFLAEVQIFGVSSVSSPTDIADESIPKVTELSQNYPNPFNPVTTIKFALPKADNVKLSVMNAKGETVKVLASGNYQAGNHSFDFNGSGLNSGVYFYRLVTKEKTITKKMIMVK